MCQMSTFNVNDADLRDKIAKIIEIGLWKPKFTFKSLEIIW